MIAADSSALARLFHGYVDRATTTARDSLQSRTLHLPPVVLTELLSNPEITDAAIGYITSLPMLKVRDGFWLRAGELRRSVLVHGKRARLADCLIAQSCIDNDVPLITYDSDFRHFQVAGLKLA